MLQKFRNFAKKQEGVTSVEYALIVVVVALVMLVGATSLGAALSGKFTSVGTSVTGTG